MSKLGGFLWSMGRCGTKAVGQTITQHTNAKVVGWVDAPRFIEAPNYFLQTYPRPFVLTMHQPQYTAQFISLLSQRRQIPVVYTVRDPVPNLESYAKIFLSSYISRRIDEIKKHVGTGGSIVASINHQAVDQWLLPMCDYWRQWTAIKDSPHLLVDFAELGEERFVQTITRMCDFFRLERIQPITWTGTANAECDNFFIGYVRQFSVLGRPMELRFSRWPDYWGEPGLVTLGGLRSPVLDEILAPETVLNVHVRADRLLTAGSIEEEREGFALLLSNDKLRDAIASQIVKDCKDSKVLIERELKTFQATLIKKFEAKYLAGVRKFVLAHPALTANWSGLSTFKAA